MPSSRATTPRASAVAASSDTPGLSRPTIESQPHPRELTSGVRPSEAAGHASTVIQNAGRDPIRSPPNSCGTTPTTSNDAPFTPSVDPITSAPPPISVHSACDSTATSGAPRTLSPEVSSLPATALTPSSPK